MRTNPQIAVTAAVAAATCAAAVVAFADDGPPAKDGGAAKAPAKAADLVPVEAFFHGRIVKLEAGAIEVRYDFDDPAQLRDFEASIPFRDLRTIQYELKSGRLSLQGTGSLRHRAVFDGEAGASATFSPRRPRDFGFAVSEERESEVFTLYCCYDRHFSAGDNVFVPQNMIVKFIPRDPKVNKDGLQDWRYCGTRGQQPEIAAGRSYKVTIGRTGLESRMTIDDWESKGREAGRDITAMMVAVYGYDAHVELDDLVVRGKLDPAWVARNKLDLTTWKPPAPAADPPKGTPPAAPSAADPATQRVRAQIAGYPVDTKPVALAALLRDVTVSAALRAEAAERAKQVGDKRIVPLLVDGLYSTDADARRVTADVLRGLTGKSFGYRADASEESRKKAIQEFNEYLKKHATDFL